MKNEYHIMLDIETMATTPDASVFQIAAKVFNPYALNGEDKDLPSFSMVAKPKTDGRKVDPSTEAFWESQDGLLEELVKQATGTGDDLWREFYKWLDAVNKKYSITATWGKGPSFDQVILRNGLVEKGHIHPNKNFILPFYKDRCVRTVVMMTAISLGKKDKDYESSVKAKLENEIGSTSMKAHNAEFDVELQIRLVKNFYYIALK